METTHYGLVDEQGRQVKLQPGVRAICDYRLGVLSFRVGVDRILWSDGPKLDDRNLIQCMKSKQQAYEWMEVIAWICGLRIREVEDEMVNEENGRMVIEFVDPKEMEVQS